MTNITHHRTRFALLAFLVACLCGSNCYADRRFVSADRSGIEFKMDPKTGMVNSLRHRGKKYQWMQQDFPIYQIPGGEELDIRLRVRSTTRGLQLRLRITNRSLQAQSVTPVFPNLQLAGADPEAHRALRYCFPARSAMIGRKDVRDRGFYSGIAPLQFFSVDHPAGGSLHAVVCDQENNRKLFGMDKTAQSLRWFVRHEARNLAPGEKWDLPPVLLGTGDGTWHDGLAAYRRWLATWYRPAAPRSAAFRKVFNFRVFYLYHGPPYNSGIFNPTDKSWFLPEGVERDTKIFGGVDFVHLFDWSKTAEQGRVGDYSPWAYNGGLANFRNQLAKLRARGVPVGLYTEGYLASPQSEVVKKHGEEWAMLDPAGKRVDTWGGGYTTMCPHVPGWQDYMARTCKRVAAETGAAGTYIDQFGFLTQYRCFNPAHAKYHPVGAHMLAGEAGMLRKIRAAVGSKLVLYTEEIPTDYMTQFTDGAYTASVKIAVSRGIRCPINMTRFALPGFKTIELIGEHGIGDQLQAVQATFFNGEGIYLSGDKTLFSAACLDLLAKTHGILRKHSDAFTSMNPVPLVPTLSENVCANRFPAKRSVVWTLLHSGSTAYSGPVLKVRHRAGARYKDAWNGAELTPKITRDGHAVITLPMKPGGAGCVVQAW